MANHLLVHLIYISGQIELKTGFFTVYECIQIQYRCGDFAAGKNQNVATTYQHRTNKCECEKTLLKNI